MIESMDLVFTHGRMVGSTLVTGKVGNNMVKALTDKLMGQKRKDTGKKEKESNG